MSTLHSYPLCILLVTYAVIYCNLSCVDDPALTPVFESMEPYTTTFGCCSAYVEPHNVQNGYLNDPNDRKFRAWTTNICDIENQYITAWRFEHGQGASSKLAFEQQSNPTDFRNDINDCSPIILESCITEDQECDNWDTKQPYTAIYGCCGADIEPHNVQNGYSVDPLQPYRQSAWLTNICDVENQFVTSMTFEHDQGFNLNTNQKLAYNQQSSEWHFVNDKRCHSMIIKECETTTTPTTPVPTVPTCTKWKEYCSSNSDCCSGNCNVNSNKCKKK